MNFFCIILWKQDVSQCFYTWAPAAILLRSPTLASLILLTASSSSTTFTYGYSSFGISVGINLQLHHQSCGYSQWIIWTKLSSDNSPGNDINASDRNFVHKRTILKLFIASWGTCLLRHGGLSLSCHGGLRPRLSCVFLLWLMMMIDDDDWW